MNNAKIAVLAGAILCLTAVALGAFGAHAFAETLTLNQRADVYQLANRYQFYHGLGLLVVGCIYKASGHGQFNIVALMLAGTLIFSGSLYALALSNIAWLGAITPVGGASLIVAWLLFTRFVYKSW